MSNVPLPSVEYREVPDFPGYRVGSDGSVWSCRTKRGKFKETWHRLACSRRRKQRYVTVCFRSGPRNHVRYVHRLVLELFVGPCPDGMECRHVNGNPSDNRLENLSWGTKAENTADQLAHGKRRFGEQAPLAKLADKDIPIIRRLYDEGVDQAIIGDAFGVAQTTISRIVSGKRWQHVS